ncbi:MAG: helix-turn-helix domain-containing protein, partial [Actinobacteria bacterium]
MTRARRPISLQEAADRLGVHYMTAYRYVRTGRLPARREGVQWMVDPADLAKMRPPERTTRGHGTIRSEGPAKLAARMAAGDEAGAWGVVEAALASGVEAADIYLDLLVPALEVVGEGWAAAELTVADEHRATAVALRLVGRLGPRFARRGRKRGTVVVGAPAGEQHGLPSAILADLLRGVGFEVLDMGANTPAASFAETAKEASRLVATAIAITTPGGDAAGRAVVKALRQADLGVPILVGGGAVRDRAHALRLGADEWSGHDGRSALVAIERIAR